MSDLDKLYESLEKLRKKSERNEALDDFVEQAIPKYKHKHLVKSLQETVGRVMNEARYSKVNLVFGTERMVRSMRINEGYITSVIDAYKFLTSGSPEYHEEFLREYDDENHRILFVDEFEKRSSVLLRKAEEGLLDDLYGIPPYEILHRIMGRHGELLDRIGIQPLDSRIYDGVKVYKPAERQPFEVLEVTIGEVHEALRSGKTTCSSRMHERLNWTKNTVRLVFSVHFMGSL
jgi:hypothetical protein